MRKNNLAGIITVSLIALFTFSACAQNHQQNEQTLSLSNSIASKTVLLNNHDTIVPLLHLERRKIASVNLGFLHQQAFDSLANKYARISSFSAAAYQNSPSLNELEDDLKYFNTILITLPANAANEVRNVNFIRNLSGTKAVIVSLFGEAKALNAFGRSNASEFQQCGRQIDTTHQSIDDTRFFDSSRPIDNKRRFRPPVIESGFATRKRPGVVGHENDDGILANALAVKLLS